jgi:hypothetical protein
MLQTLKTLFQTLIIPNLYKCGHCLRTTILDEEFLFSFFLELSQIDRFDVANQLEAIDGRVSFLRVQFDEVEISF